MNKENDGKIIFIDTKTESVNPFKDALTIEKLKTFEGLEKLNEEDASIIVNDIHTLCRIIYEFMTDDNEKPNSETNNNQQKQAA